MLKVFFRILVFLLIIAVVAGGIYLLVQKTSIGAAFGRGDYGERAFTTSSGTYTGQTISVNNFGERGEGRFSFSPGRGLTGVLGNGIEILAITLAVLAVRKAIAPRLLRVRPIRIDRS
jgi:hypothetical protein